MFVYKVTAFVIFIPVLLPKLRVTTSHILIWRLCLINTRFISFITQTMKSYRDSPSLEILINQTINSLSAQSTPNIHRERPSYEWRHKMGKLYKIDSLAIILLGWLGGWIIYNVPNPSKFLQILTFPPPTLVPMWREEIFKLLLNCRSLTVMSVIMS